MLGVVDCVVRNGRRRPVQARIDAGAGAPLQIPEVGDPAGQRPLDVQRVERRHAGTRIGHVEAGIGEIQPARGGAGRDLQQQAFAAGPVVLGRQPRSALRAVVQDAPRLVEQQRVLAVLLRKDPLGQARYEHHVEQPAAGMLRAAHEHPAVALRGGGGRQLRQPLGQHVAHLGKRYRTDPRHRPQLAQHRQHAVRLPQRHRDQCLQGVQPVAPRRFIRERGQALDHRQREPLQMAEVTEIALDGLEARGLRIVSRAGGAAQLQLLRQAGKPAAPAVEPAYDRGVDQQAVPLPGGARRIGRGRLADGAGVFSEIRFGAVRWRRVRQCRRRQQLRGLRGMAPGVKVLGRGAVGAERRRLRDGKVLREPARRQPLGGARQQRQQRAAAGIWCARAARKPRRRTGAAQRGLERRRIHVRGAHQDRHPVQRDAAGRFLQNGAGDLHALASLPGRGEEHDIAVGGGRGRPRWRRVGREQIAAHPRQGAGPSGCGGCSRRTPGSCASVSSVRRSPAGTVASSRGARAASASTSARVASSGTATSSSRIGPGGNGSPPAAAAAAVRSNPARSTSPASASRWS